LKVNTKKQIEATAPSFNFGKWAFLLALVAIAWIAFFQFKYASHSRIRYVNNEKLMSEYKGVQNVQKEIEIDAKNIKGKIDSLYINFEAEIKNFEKNRPNLSAKEVELSQQLLNNKEEQINNRRSSLEQQLQKIQGAKLEPVLAALDNIVKEYSKSNKFDIVLGVSANGSMLYAEDAYNITDDLIKYANSKVK
jgi:outer membrane protein